MCVYMYMMVVDKAPPSLLVFPSVVKLGHLCNNTDINSVWWNRVGLHMCICGCAYIFYICTCYDGVDKASSWLSVFPSVVKLGHLYGKFVLTLLVKQCIIYGDRRTVFMLIYPSMVKWVLHEVNRLALCSKTEYSIYVYTHVYVYVYVYVCM